jgi:hypothetical protein
MRCERGSVVAVLPAGSLFNTFKRSGAMRAVGLDIHRVSAEAVAVKGTTVERLGRIGMTRAHLEAFGRTLTHDDHVIIEATGNAGAVAEALRPYVGRVVIANPRQVRLIAEARIKTDVIDATVLARLYALTSYLKSGFQIRRHQHCAGKSLGETRSCAKERG